MTVLPPSNLSPLTLPSFNPPRPSFTQQHEGSLLRSSLPSPSASPRQLEGISALSGNEDLIWLTGHVEYKLDKEILFARVLEFEFNTWSLSRPSSLPGPRSSSPFLVYGLSASFGPGLR